MLSKLRLLIFSFFVVLTALSPAAIFSQSSPSGVERIVLEVSPQQVTGRALLGTNRILIYDVGDILQYDYSLFINPIRMTATNGAMYPSLLNDPTWCDSGVVDISDLSQIGMKYIGPSGVVNIQAENDSGNVSNYAVVSFNGYDVLDVFDFKGDQLTHVFSGYPITARVVVSNGGTLRSETNPSLRTSFTSGGGSVRVFFSPDDSGAVDTIPISINTAGLAVGIDTLIIDLEATYRIDTALYTTRFRDSIPIEVKATASVNLQNGELDPDSVYAGVNFPMGVTINAPGFEGPIDSSYIRVDLLYGPSDALATTLCAGPATPTSFGSNVIQYGNVTAQISLAAGLLPGWYHLRTNYSLVSGGSVFSINDLVSDSIYILPFTSPQYVPETFAPDTVAAGGLTAFSFDLTVTDVDFLFIDTTTGRAILTISDTNTGFTSTAPMILPGGILNPGRNTVTSDQIFIPLNELGRDLTVSASLQYSQTSSGGFLPYTTDFDGQLVRVLPLPIAQVVLTRSVAPNAPHMNVGQPFLIRTRIANVSDSPLDSLVLRMTSDGPTIDVLLDTIARIEPHDTATIEFPITGFNTVVAEEVRVDIISTHHGQLAPSDNLATLFIDSPADLRLSDSLRGTTSNQHFVETGGTFFLQVIMSKIGQSGVSQGNYHLSTQGLDLGFPNQNGQDTLGEILADQQIVFEMTAPPVETTFTLRFTLTDRPIDSNTAAPARFTGDSTFSYVIRVASTFAQLYVSKVESPSMPLYKDVLSELFELDLTNLAQSAVNAVGVEQICLRLVNEQGNPLAVADGIDPATVAFYDGETELTSPVISADTVFLQFDNCEIPAGASRTITLRAKPISAVGSAFGIILDTSGVKANYVDGPAQGDPVTVTSPPNGRSILEKFFAVTGQSLEQSFIIEDNPWHPGNGDARFSYSLSEASPIEFRVFTLTGEQVLVKRYETGTPQTEIGSHIVRWDGRNGAGNMVHDGVYIVCLVVDRTGEEVRMKVAVLK